MSSDARWWLVRARYADGWRSRLVDARESSVHLAADVEGALPRFITVTAVDRVGIESPPVVIQHGDH
jgi:hypothetical protein